MNVTTYHNDNAWTGQNTQETTHNVLYVATERDSLYAIDADKGTVYWQVSLIPSGGSTVNKHQ